MHKASMHLLSHTFQFDCFLYASIKNQILDSKHLCQNPDYSITWQRFPIPNSSSFFKYCSHSLLSLEAPLPPMFPDNLLDPSFSSAQCVCFIQPLSHRQSDRNVLMESCSMVVFFWSPLCAEGFWQKRHSEPRFHDYRCKSGTQWC